MDGNLWLKKKIKILYVKKVKPTIYILKNTHFTSIPQISSTKITSIFVVMTVLQYNK